MSSVKTYEVNNKKLYLINDNSDKTKVITSLKNLIQDIKTPLSICLPISDDEEIKFDDEEIRDIYNEMNIIKATILSTAKRRQPIIVQGNDLVIQRLHLKPEIHTYLDIKPSVENVPELVEYLLKRIIIVDEVITMDITESNQTPLFIQIINDLDSLNLGSNLNSLNFLKYYDDLLVQMSRSSPNAYLKKNNITHITSVFDFNEYYSLLENEKKNEKQIHELVELFFIGAYELSTQTNYNQQIIDIVDKHKLFELVPSFAYKGKLKPNFKNYKKAVDDLVKLKWQSSIIQEQNVFNVLCRIKQTSVQYILKQMYKYPQLNCPELKTNKNTDIMNCVVKACNVFKCLKTNTDEDFMDILLLLQKLADYTTPLPYEILTMFAKSDRDIIVYVNDTIANRTSVLLDTIYT
jgi:hypothetical protein